MKKIADMPIFKEHYAFTNMIIDIFFFILKYNKQKAYLEYEVTSTVNTLFVIWLQHTVLWINNGFYHDCGFHHVKHWDKSLPVPERAFCLFVDAAVSEITATNLSWRIRSLWGLCSYITLNYRNPILLLQHNTELSYKNPISQTRWVLETPQ